MMLLTWMPVPGTTTPEPSPFVHVTEQARPSPSTTEMCVVEPQLRDGTRGVLGAALRRPRMRVA